MPLADVFISYKRHRRPGAEYLAQILALNGFEAWYDLSLDGAEAFEPQILAQITEAKAVVVLWCARAAASEWVQREAQLALDAGKYVPCVIEEVSLPASFAEIQQIDLSPWSGEPDSHDLHHLFDALARKVGRPRAPDRRGLKRQFRTWSELLGRKPLREMVRAPSSPSGAVAGPTRVASPAPARPAPPEAARPGQAWVVPGLELPMVWVPPGEFTMGAQDTDPSQPGYDPDAQADESPVRRMRLTSGFWLGRHPVTNAQYQRFVDKAGHRVPGPFKQPGLDKPQQPVNVVNWHDASAFCRWMTDQLAPGWVAALPTEAMWERAARGDDGRKYPWGNEEPDATRAVFGAKLATIGGRPAGVGPYGTHDQAGLVWEWCRDGYGPYGGAPVVDVRVDSVDAAGAAPRVTRGGSWIFGAERLRAACRFNWHPKHAPADQGFRVCVYREPGARP